jgi:hypothetical protein
MGEHKFELSNYFPAIEGDLWIKLLVKLDFTAKSRFTR